MEQGQPQLVNDAPAVKDNVEQPSQLLGTAPAVPHLHTSASTGSGHCMRPRSPLEPWPEGQHRESPGQVNDDRF